MGVLEHLGDGPLMGVVGIGVGTEPKVCLGQKITTEWTHAAGWAGDPLSLDPRGTQSPWVLRQMCPLSPVILSVLEHLGG